MIYAVLPDTLRRQNAADFREELAAMRKMMAGHVFAVLQGMSTRAKDGAARDKLLRIASGVTAHWPASRSG